MMKRKEVERTCKRCDNVWYLDPKVLKEKAPSRLETFGAKSRATGDRLSGSGKRGAGELQLMNLEARSQRVANNKCCPNCGSQAFTERMVKV